MIIPLVSMTVMIRWISRYGERFVQTVSTSSGILIKHDMCVCRKADFARVGDSSDFLDRSEFFAVPSNCSYRINL